MPFFCHKSVPSLATCCAYMSTCPFRLSIQQTYAPPLSSEQICGDMNPPETGFALVSQIASPVGLHCADENCGTITQTTITSETFLRGCIRNGASRKEV